MQTTKLVINPLNTELNPICYMLALLGAHRILHVSRIRVKQFCFVSCCFLSLMPKYVISTHDRSPSACFFPRRENKISHPHKTTDGVHVLIFMPLIRKWEDIRYWG